MFSMVGYTSGQFQGWGGVVVKLIGLTMYIAFISYKYVIFVNYKKCFEQC